MSVPSSWAPGRTGKGSVQGITYYPGGGAQLKYTMAYYHLPSGQRVKSRDEVEKEGRKDWGVGPDVEVSLTSDELRQMLETQRNNDVLAQTRQEGDKGAVTATHRRRDAAGRSPVGRRASGRQDEADRGRRLASAPRVWPPTEATNWFVV